MAKWDGLDTSKNNIKETSSQMNYEKTMPSKMIIDLFLMEQHNFFLQNWGTISRYSPEFQPLSKIFDLINLEIESMKIWDNCLTVEISAIMDEVITKSLLANGGEWDIFEGGRMWIKFSNKEKNIKIIIYKK